MILRRLSQSLKEQNWMAIAIEFVLLVLGVFLGIQVANWNQKLADARLGQEYVLRLKSDLVDVLLAATEPGPHGRLDTIEREWDRRPALGVVMAAHGYPLTPRKGDAITGLPADKPEAMVFHAGTVRQDGATVTAGGRVLCVTALGDSVKAAQQAAYQLAQGIHFDGAQYRTDIGHLAIRLQGGDRANH